MNRKRVIIPFMGGIVSPGYLKVILQIAASVHVQEVRFGLRQQMIMDIPGKNMQIFTRSCKEHNIVFHLDKSGLPNIVSSYPATGIFTADHWMREGTYKDIFDLFDYQPTLKINICEHTQSLAPLFTGHLNWITSDLPHFWYLYVRLPGTKTAFCISRLIYTNDIVEVSKKMEAFINKKKYSDQDIPALFNSIVKDLPAAKPVTGELSTPTFSLPYYEGFNKSGNSYWLGIYRRDELFPISFLSDLCDVCLETKTGQLYTTPWKSIIIKNIASEHRPLWDYVLGKYRINVRHAANELNWQVEDYKEEALAIKRNIIRHFDKEDVRTYGLCFSVQSKYTFGTFGSVIIRKQQNQTQNKLKALDKYDILYRENFDPNAGALNMFREGVLKDHIATYLVSVCKLFYEKGNGLNKPPDKGISAVANSTSVEESNKEVYQCMHCLTVYDELAGDEQASVVPGTPFNELPDDYECALCGGDKISFVPVTEAEMYGSVL